MKSTQSNGTATRNDAGEQLAKSIESWLIAKISDWLVIDANEIDRTQPTTLYGMNSMAAMTMAGELEDWLNIELEATALFDHPSVDELTRYLVEMLQASGSDAVPTPDEGSRA